MLQKHLNHAQTTEQEEYEGVRDQRGGRRDVLGLGEMERESEWVCVGVGWEVAEEADSQRGGI